MNTISFYKSDPWLKPFTEVIDRRIAKCLSKEKKLIANGTLCDFAMGHYYYGLHRNNDSWVFREWAPNAKNIFVIGEFTDWMEKKEFMMKRINPMGDWEIILSPEALKHGDLYKLSVHWEGGNGERIPSYANRVIQDEETKIFNAQVWQPDKNYILELQLLLMRLFTAPVIYEAHIGMATSEEKTGTYREIY